MSTNENNNILNTSYNLNIFLWKEILSSDTLINNINIKKKELIGKYAKTNYKNIKIPIEYKLINIIDEEKLNEAIIADHRRSWTVIINDMKLTYNNNNKSSYITNLNNELNKLTNDSEITIKIKINLYKII